MGKTPPRKDNKYWDNATHSWISIADMVADGYIKNSKEKVNDYSVKNIFKNQISKKGTLLMSFKLTVGRVSILSIDAFHNEAIISIIPYYDINNILRNYLFTFLPLLTNYGNTKTAIKGNTLNSTSIDNLLIPISSFSEQQRISIAIEKYLTLINKKTTK